RSFSLSSPSRVCPSFLSLSPPRALPHSSPIRLMEALAGAAASSALLPAFPAHQPHSRVALRARPCGPIRAAGGGGGKDDAAKPNGTPVVKSKVDPSQNGALGPVATDKSRTTSSTNSTPDSSGSRAGLFRTPISGGVQSATFAHGLPPPALAVRNLMEQARFAHLCTVMSGMHHRRAGYPFGSLVDFANDSMGHPIFSLSPLAIHTRNLLSDPRCTLVVQVPGWSGLSNARVTIFGDVYPLSAEQQEWAHKQYVAKHQQWASQQWGNFYYYRMQNIRSVI
uniref:CREG-like beta-barrel domain-containing protein n=1 Tax=Aegilops tauschii subsp. strangulata TaxID=200361 RepID=A0A453RLP5_AEGTS